MQKVKLKRDWKQYEEGRVLTTADRPSYTLQFLTEQGWAVDVSDTSPEIPTQKNTVKEIKTYLDFRGVEYESGELKADLLDKVNGVSDSE